MALKRRFLLVLALTLFLAGTTAGYLLKRYRMAANTTAIQSVPIPLRAAQRFTGLPGAKVVMIGDSIIFEGEWSELLGFSVANRGVSGDMVATLAERLAVSIPAKAEQVFLMIGVNDLSGNATSAATADSTAAIVKSLAPRKVVLQSVLLTRNAELNAKVLDLNLRNRAFCQSGACDYLELNDLFSEKGQLAERFTTDGIHLNGAAYVTWAARIAPLVR